MSKIHENLENKAFNVPADIVPPPYVPSPASCRSTGCADLKTEYFAEGTVPTETCDVHYQGMVCEYSGLPATDLCPFQVPGTIEHDAFPGCDSDRKRNPRRPMSVLIMPNSLRTQLPMPSLNSNSRN